MSAKMHQRKLADAILAAPADDSLAATFEAYVSAGGDFTFEIRQVPALALMSIEELKATLRRSTA